MYRKWIIKVYSLLLFSSFFLLGSTALAQRLILPQGINRIEAGAFDGCTQFTGTLVIPEGVTYIGARAFAGCTGLSGTVRIPDSVEYLAPTAFDGCYRLTISGRNSEMNTSKYTFKAIEGGYSVTGYTGRAYEDLIIPSRYMNLPVIEIAERAFYDRRNEYTGTLSIPEGIVAIGKEAFYGCWKMEGSLTLPKSLKRIDSRAFMSCTFSGKLSIPLGVTRISDSAFWGCDFSEIELHEGIESIGANAFRQCSDITGVLHIPASVVEIGEYAFSYSERISGVKFFQGLETIGQYAFAQCTGLKGSIDLPDSVTKVSQYAFYQCVGLDGYLRLSQNMTSIGTSAFEGCSGLKGDLILPDSLTYLGSSAFRECSGFDGRLTLSSGLTEIAKYAFGNCSGLIGDLIIPNNVKTIRHYAFGGCSGFDGKLKLPEGLEQIEYIAFENCSGFTGMLILPLSVKEVKREAFSGCRSLESVYIENGIVWPSSCDVFKNCKGLKLVIWGINVGLRDYFAGCDSIETICGIQDSGAQMYAENLGINFIPWDFSLGIMPPTEGGAGIPLGYYRITDAYSVDGQKFYKAEIIKSYNGVPASTDMNTVHAYLDRELRPITDIDLLSKLFTMYIYGDKREWEEKLNTWKTNTITWRDTATDIMQMDLIMQTYGSAVGSAIATLMTGGTSALDELLNYVVGNVVDADKITALGTIAYINMLTEHMAEVIDYTNSIPVKDDTGIYNYEKVMESLELYKYTAVCFDAVNGLCMPVIDDILEKYSSDWAVAWGNIANIATAMIDSAAKNVTLSCVNKVFGAFLGGGSTSKEILTRMTVFLTSEPGQWTVDFFNGSIDLLFEFSGVKLEDQEDLLNPYIWTSEEMLDTQLYRDQLLLAQ